MDEVYVPRYTFRVSQPSNVIFPSDVPSDGYFLHFMVADRFENFYYSSTENLWKFYNIAPGPVHTNIAFCGPRELFLSENSNWEDVSYMLQEANIPLGVHLSIIPHIDEIAVSIANDPANASPKLLPILVEIIRWRFLDITAYLAEEDFEIGDAHILDFQDYEMLAHIASLSIAQNESRANPASENALNEMLKKVTIEAADGVETCTICLEDFPNGMEATQMPCTHVFHGECIIQWLNINNMCPLCRFEMPVAPNNN